MREQRFREAEDYFRRALAVLGPASERDARREALYKNLVRLASILHRIERTDDAERVMGIVASHAQVEGRPAERQRDYRRLYDDLAERRLSPRMQPIQISGGTPRTGIDGLIQTAARTHRMDPALVKAVVAAESNFDSRAVSHAGALGLMQLMPETARELGVRAPFDPRQNIDGGTRYLRQMLDRFGEIKHALAAYNAGPDAVDRYGGVPPFDETREYVRRVLSFYQDFRAQFTR